MFYQVDHFRKLLSIDFLSDELTVPTDSKPLTHGYISALTIVNLKTEDKICQLEIKSNDIFPSNRRTHKHTHPKTTVTSEQAVRAGQFLLDHQWE